MDFVQSLFQDQWAQHSTVHDSASYINTFLNLDILD